MVLSVHSEVGEDAKRWHCTHFEISTERRSIIGQLKAGVWGIIWRLRYQKSAVA